MKTITIEVPDEMTSLGGGTDKELAGAMRLATAILWYQQGRISQGKAAEFAGMNRVLFLNALHDAGVEAIQVTEEELRREMELPAVRIVNASPLILLARVDCLELLREPPDSDVSVPLAVFQEVLAGESFDPHVAAIRRRSARGCTLFPPPSGRWTGPGST